MFDLDSWDRKSLFIRTWIRPSFENPCEWQLFRKAWDDSTELGVRRLYGFPDFRRIHSQYWVREESKFCRFEDAKVDINRLNDLLSELKHLSCNAIAPSGCGLDGTTSGVAFTDENSDSSFEWWAMGPDQWMDLATWTGRLQHRLDTFFEHPRITHRGGHLSFHSHSDETSSRVEPKLRCRLPWLASDSDE